MSYLDEYYKKARQKKEAEYILRKSRLGDNPISSLSYDSITALGMAMYANSDFTYEIPAYNSIEEVKAKLSDAKHLFSEEMKKRIQQQKEYLIELQKQKENMKTKNFYHTFEYENRKVTLCLHVHEQYQSYMEKATGNPKIAHLEVGYAVCVPEDKFDQDLAKKISLGRATKEGKELSDFSLAVPVEYAFDLGILKGLAYNFERRIKYGEVVIKGIR